MQALLLSNVLVVGGLAACPGFTERLARDLRPLIPDHLQVRKLALLCQRVNDACACLLPVYAGGLCVLESPAS